MNWARFPSLSPYLLANPLANRRLLGLAAILVGFALRLYRLGAESLWYDETVSVALAQKDIPALLRHTAGDIHPPGYYLLLHYWQGLTQPIPALGLEFLYAWLSLCFGLLLMALLFALGRAFFSSQVALFALWLAAINPYHIWYSQEVRMYTLGALLGLLCFWGLTQWWRIRPQPATVAATMASTAPTLATRTVITPLLLYIGAGTIGLYTLYYFLFTLIALNWIAFLCWWGQRHTRNRPKLAPWLGAQVALLCLWTPWLPIFWRQATEPPVPPWRVPWSTPATFFAAVAEGASALISGQSTPAATAWPWPLLLLGIGLCAYLYQRRILPSLVTHGFWLVSSYVFIPVVALYAITTWITPLYHVRYLFTYAPPFLLLLAAALLFLHQWQPRVGILTSIGLVALNGWSLYTFWGTPAFQADDHRGAVAQLAQAWRPGDAIVVNAGWVYTALTTYWPTTLLGVDAALPPPLAPPVRLLDYPKLHEDTTVSPSTALLVRTGSVDGAANLGWGDPASDFFAMKRTVAQQALDQLGRDYPRLWHYRLYDTVSDPQGIIRAWFAQEHPLQMDTPMPGRDYLRLQLYANPSTLALPMGEMPLPLPPTPFQGGLWLQQATLTAATVPAGSYLYADFQWQPPVDQRNLPPQISFSLRLYDKTEQRVAQADATPPLPVAAWPTPYHFPLALPIPVATVPGAYKLVVIAYDPQNGTALALAESEPTQQALSLGTIHIAPATQRPILPKIQASFGYIDLVHAQLTTPQPTTDETLTLELVWRPRDNNYRDTYIGQLLLQESTGTIVGQWEAALGGWDYPSGGWPPGLPVREWRVLPLDPNLPVGNYTLHLRVLRASDQQRVPARVDPWWLPWHWRTDESLLIGQVILE
ncbi:MAG: hypothetical protein KF832_29880 [Caldilineaceae bacterium]|nr:hypothetical protein [Caldilineaceae bacterium]